MQRWPRTRSTDTTRRWRPGAHHGHQARRSLGTLRTVRGVADAKRGHQAPERVGAVTEVGQPARAGGHRERQRLRAIDAAPIGWGSPFVEDSVPMV